MFQFFLAAVVAKRIVKLEFFAVSTNFGKIIVAHFSNRSAQNRRQGNILPWIVKNCQKTYDHADLSRIKKSTLCFQMRRYPVCIQYFQKLLSLIFRRTHQYRHIAILRWPVLSVLAKHIHRIFRIHVLAYRFRDHLRFGFLVRFIGNSEYRDIVGVPLCRLRKIRSEIQHRLFIIGNSAKIFLHNIRKYVICRLQHDIPASEILRQKDKAVFRSVRRLKRIHFLQKQIRPCIAKAVNALLDIAYHKTVIFFRYTAK